MPSLTAIRVTIGLKPNGEHLYPDWTLLPSFTTEADVKAACPFGWHYDKASGHEDEDGQSPLGTQQGIRLVTPTMATEAVAMFGGPPFNVTQLTEAQLEVFWDNRHAPHIPDDVIDYEEIDGLRAALELAEHPDVAAALPNAAAAKNKIIARIVKVFDPTNLHPGFRKQPMKVWADAKAKRNITYVEPT